MLTDLCRDVELLVSPTGGAVHHHCERGQLAHHRHPAVAAPHPPHDGLGNAAPVMLQKQPLYRRLRRLGETLYNKTGTLKAARKLH